MSPQPGTGRGAIAAEKYGNSFFWGNKGFPIGFSVNHQREAFAFIAVKTCFAGCVSGCLRPSQEGVKDGWPGSHRPIK
jgi:hypothetical protein